MAEKEKKPWKKILWEKQHYPDNYTDYSFLDDLKKNIYKREISFKEAFLGASLVTQQLCLIVSFSLSFVYLHNHWLNSETILILISLFTFLGYIVYNLDMKSKPNILYNILSISFESIDLKRHLLDVISFIVLGYVLSPVLKTLTETISTDTIYSMTVFMMGVHLVFFDYGVQVAIVSSSLSMNAAVFGALCLVSRLETPFDAFALLTSAVFHFLLCPLLVSKLNCNAYPILIFMVAFCTFGLYLVNYIMTALFLTTVYFLNIIFPYLFVKWHSYKDNIYGPWDEAVVHLN